MQKFTLHKGIVAPMDRENVDTDAIIPKLSKPPEYIASIILCSICKMYKLH